jgi:histidinol-phosphatase (PHP family)
MREIKLYDMHTHSIHSFDGNDSCEKLCESAVSKNATGFAITDHCDIDGAELDIDSLCTNQLSSLDFCLNEYQSLDIIKGIEIGQGIYRKTETEKLLNTYNYDFVLGSLHNLENMEDFYFLNYKENNPIELLEKYFDGLLELANWGKFDSLAHLTYPLRYMIGRDKLDIDMTMFDEQINTVLEAVAKNKKALEINTSGLFTDLNDTLPSIKYVKRFKELGGKYITVGSDSHYADKLFQGIKNGYDIARACGFEYITIYKNHEPVLVEI